MKKIRLATALISVVALLYFHIYFIANKIYFYFWWSDIFMHFLGGFTLGLLFLVIFSTQKNLCHVMGFKKVFWMIVLIVIALGIVWELYELSIGATFTLPRESYYLDTFIDLVLDTIGGITAIKLFNIFEITDGNIWQNKQN